jgi:hypothetical protein
VVVVLESVNIKKQVVVYYFLKYKQAIDDYEDSKEAQDKHAHEEKVVAQLLVLELCNF